MRNAVAATSTITLADIAAEYERSGLPVAMGATGISLFTNDTLCAIELPRELSAGVREYLKANGMLGPVVALPGATTELHIAVGFENAPLAAEALRKQGATIYANGDVVALPPTKIQPGEAKWIVAMADTKRIQPVVAISAAVRAAVKAAAQARKAS